VTLTLFLQGGLGNQLFQWASATVLARAINLPLRINTSDYLLNNDQRELEISKLIRSSSISYSTDNEGFLLRRNPVSQFFAKRKYGALIDDNNYLETSKFYNVQSLMMRGYFQNYEYFDDHKSELMLATENPKNGAVINDFSEYISIHVRRQDYLALQDIYEILDTNYYIQACQAVNSIHPNSKFLLFGDDKLFCEGLMHNLQERSINVTLVPGQKNTALNDFTLMRACAGHIIANSTFSWWAAYLSKDSKVTIRPRNWYTDGHCVNCPNNWIKI
jgi:hypothetical protein